MAQSPRPLSPSAPSLHHADARVAPERQIPPHHRIQHGNWVPAPVSPRSALLHKSGTQVAWLRFVTNEPKDAQAANEAIPEEELESV